MPKQCFQLNVPHWARRLSKSVEAQGIWHISKMQKELQPHPCTFDKCRCIKPSVISLIYFKHIQTSILNPFCSKFDERMSGLLLSHGHELSDMLCTLKPVLVFYSLLMLSAQSASSCWGQRVWTDEHALRQPMEVTLRKTIEESLLLANSWWSIQQVYQGLLSLLSTFIMFHPLPLSTPQTPPLSFCCHAQSHFVFAQEDLFPIALRDDLPRPKRPIHRWALAWTKRKNDGSRPPELLPVRRKSHFPSHRRHWHPQVNWKI